MLLGIITDRNLSSLAQITLVMLRLQSATFVPRVAHIRKFLRCSERTGEAVMRNLRLAGYCELRKLATRDESGSFRTTGSHYVFYDTPQPNLIDHAFVKAVAAGADPGFKSLCRIPRATAVQALSELDNVEA